LGRRKARAVTIQILYQLEMNMADIEHTLHLYWEKYNNPDDTRLFVDHQVKGIAEHKTRIDQIIKKTAKNWSFNRITPVDRSILREAVYELFYCPDIPTKVTLNEAIELGKKFGSEKSGAFINGILDNILEKYSETITQIT
jgi:transcription antitermination protein NusB